MNEYKNNSLYNLNKKYRICIYKNCETYATFNYEDKIDRLFCKKHKLPNMVSLLKKNKCKVCKDKIPICNYEDKKYATHCWNCKLENMIIVLNILCRICHINIPYYNYPEKTHCKECKLPGMKNVVNKICIVCKKTQANFNHAENTKATHCSKCKEPGMIDIKSKRCDACKTIRPYYNYPGSKTPTHCNTCKKPGMVDIRNAFCITCKETRASYNKPDQKNALYCVSCKLPGIIDVVSTKCKNGCGKIITYDGKYESMCYTCYCLKNPDFVKEVKRRYKEELVMKFIKSSFPDHEWRFDKAIPAGISRRRPDGLLNFKDYVIWYEVDEFQHTDSNYITRDIWRVDEIVDDLKNEIHVLFRFNTDSYKIRDEVIKSPFGFDKDKKMILTNHLEFEVRLTKLKNKIQYFIDNPPDESVTEYLFYDLVEIS